MMPSESCRVMRDSGFSFPTRLGVLCLKSVGCSVIVLYDESGIDV